MRDSMTHPTTLLIALAVFVAVLLLAEGLYLLWQRNFGSRARTLERRLKLLQAQRLELRAQVLKSQAVTALDRAVHHLSAHQGLKLLLQQADLPWSASRLLLMTALLALATYALSNGVLRLNGTLSLVGALGAAALPWAHLLGRRRRRLARLQQQLPEALDLMARALQAGHAFSSALQMVAQEMPEPMAPEFRTVHDEVHFGMSLHHAFAGLTQRVPLGDLRYFTVAVLIQRESGGNLAELLASLAQLIRNRLKLLSRVRVLSSEGRLSAWILVMLPFVLGGLLAYFNPEFMSPLWTDPLGLSLLNWMLALMALGVLMIQKIVRLRV